MRRFFSTWMCAQKSSLPVTSAVGITRAADLTNVTGANVLSCGRSSLYITVRGAATAAAKSAASTKARQRRKKTTAGPKSAAVFSGGDEAATGGKGAKGRRTKKVMREEEEEVADDDTRAMFGGDALDESESIWAEGRGKMRESDALGFEEETRPSSRGQRRSQSKLAVDSDELEEGDDREEDGAAPGSTTGGDDDTVPRMEEESRFLKDRFSDLAAEYDTEANQEPLEEVFVDSARVASWKCVECGFKWKSGVFVRTCLRTKCPQCERERNPCLGSRLIQLWDHSLNDPCIDPKTVTASSNKTAYWRCPTCSTSYQARIKDMVAEKARCPSCSLLNLHADFSKDENGLLQEWHPLKNGDLQPSQAKPTDHTKLWWLCMACGHEWEATLAARLSKSRRTRGKDCPVCQGKGKD